MARQRAAKRYDRHRRSLVHPFSSKIRSIKDLWRIEFRQNEEAAESTRGEAGCGRGGTGYTWQIQEKTLWQDTWRGGRIEAGLVLFKRHVNTTPVELHTDKRHSFRPRLNMRFLLPLCLHSPTSLSPSRFHGSRPSLTYSSAPRSRFITCSVPRWLDVPFVLHGEETIKIAATFIIRYWIPAFSSHGPPWEQLPHSKMLVSVTDMEVGIYEMS